MSAKFAMLNNLVMCCMYVSKFRDCSERVGVIGLSSCLFVSESLYKFPLSKHLSCALNIEDV